MLSENEEKCVEKRPIDVIAHPYDFKLEDNPETGKSRMSIWAIGRDEKRYLLRQENCPVFCYLSLPKFVEGKRFSWDSYSSSKVFEYLQKVLKSSDDAPTKYIYCKCKEIYNYQGKNSSPMILVYFNTKKAMDHCTNLLKRPANIKNYGKVEIKVLENNISMVRKIFSLRKCNYAQWFKITGTEIPIGHPERTTVAGKNNRIKEVLIDWKNLNPIPNSKTKGWSSSPDIFAFDVETYSNNHKRMPNELCADNYAYMIQGVAQRQGQRHTRRRYAFLIGDCNEVNVGLATKVTFNGETHYLDPSVKIVRVKTEPELIKAYAKVIMEEDPDVVTGYNIMSYDYKYLDTRLSMFYMESWPQMGRLIGTIPIMTKREWKSGAYGHNVVCNLEMDGRINIDMLPIVKRDYKLAKYTLDFVCKKFLKRGKHDVSASQMFETFEFMEAAEKLKDEMNEKLKASGLKPIMSNPDIENDLGIFIEIGDDKVTPKDVKKIWQIALDQMTKVVMYGVEDSELVVDLFEKLNVWIGLVELSSIVGVSITDLFTRGQQVRCLSQIYNLSMSLGYVINKRQAKQMFFNGGYVGDPIVGLHDNVICVDFSSLYPSIMMAYNICYTTFVTPEFDDQVPDSMCNIIEFDQEEDVDFNGGMEGNGDTVDDGFNPKDFTTAIDDEDTLEIDQNSDPKKVIKHYRFRFIKAEYLEGILPTLVRNLVGERSLVKVMKSNAKKEFKNVEKFLVNAKKAETPEEIETQLDLCEELFLKYESEDIIAPERSYENYINHIRKIASSLDTQFIIFDKRQNALKVSANSMYGFIGAQKRGMLSLIEGAMCVTAMGRRHILEVNEYCERVHNGTVVYGDTDSSMVKFPHVPAEKSVQFGLDLAIEVSGKPAVKDKDGNIIEEAVKGLFPPPLKIEFEKAMRILCLKKKKYAYLPIMLDGTFEINPDTNENVIEKKGIVPARRDNCKCLREKYIDLLLDVLLMKPMDYAFGKLIDCTISLFSGKLRPRDTLTVIRQLGSEYKNENYFMCLFASELTRVGKPAKPGERLEYVIVKTKEELEGKEVKLGLKMRDIDMWEDSWKFYNSESDLVDKKVGDVELESLPEDLAKILNVKIEKNNKPTYEAEEIDYLYYIEHALMNPLDQLFSIGYKSQLEKYVNVGYTPQFSRCHFCSITTPLKMVGKLITDLNKGNMPKEIILETLEGLKSWFIKSRKDVDIMEIEESKKEEYNKKVRTVATDKVSDKVSGEKLKLAKKQMSIIKTKRQIINDKKKNKDIKPKSKLVVDVPEVKKPKMQIKISKGKSPKIKIKTPKQKLKLVLRS